MPFIQVSGTIPGLIRENSRPGDWIGGLALTGDIAGLAAIEITGAAALNFTVSWNAALGLAVIGVGAPIDFEAFAPAGLPPQLDFSLRYVFADGTRLAEANTWHVTVVDQNDTPPSGIHFATGGSVVAGAIGSIIGTLAVTDPDSVGSFSYSFAEEDAWRFEVVGTTLKLKDGISLGLDDMPDRPLFINVSDGRQSAAFTLDITVRDPAAQEDAVGTVTPDTPQSGFVQTTPQQVVTLHEARDLAAANAYDGDVRQILLAMGGEVWLPPVQHLRLADGWVDYDPAGDAVRAAALHVTLTGQAATGADLAHMVGQAQAGLGWVELAATLLPQAAGSLGDADLVTSLYTAALQRDPDPAELALQTGRLASGVSRAQIAADLAGSAATLAAHSETEGVWVSQPLGGDTAWHMDTGGLPTGLPVIGSAPIGAAWML